MCGETPHLGFNRAAVTQFIELPQSVTADRFASAERKREQLFHGRRRSLWGISSSYSLARVARNTTTLSPCDRQRSSPRCWGECFDGDSGEIGRVSPCAPPTWSQPIECAVDKSGVLPEDTQPDPSSMVPTIEYPSDKPGVLPDPQPARCVLGGFNHGGALRAHQKLIYLAKV
jgi:hypothetical protein